MAEISTGNIKNNNVNYTPLVNYNGSYVNPQIVSDSQNNPYTSQIYQYPQNSIYNPSQPQTASGVNINIYNPAGFSTPNMNPSYIYPAGSCITQPIVQQTQPLPETKNIQNDSVVANTPIKEDEISSKTKETDNTKTKEVVEINDNYIKTLENYLRSADNTVRRNGINELVKRFEEDSSRYDHPALTALLNIALQDSDPANRILAMTPVATGSAHGDENTAKILQQLQSSDKLYGEEAKMANESLLNTVKTKKQIADDTK